MSSSSATSVIPRLERASVSMRALDEHAWTAGVVVTAFGVRIGVRVDDAATLPLVLERLPPGSEPARGDLVDHVYSLRTSATTDGRPYYRVNGDHELLAGTNDRDSALLALESGLRLGVASDAPDWVFVHAGVVGWKDRAIVIPAPSRHGKSTMVAALLKAGASYYSDEYAVLDRRGRVHAFAKPISLRQAEGLPRRVHASDIGAPIGKAGVPIGVIVATTYEPQAVWEPAGGTEAQAVIALLSNTVAARQSPKRTMRVLTRAARGALFLQGSRPEADATAAAIIEAADRSARARAWPLLDRLRLSR